MLKCTELEYSIRQNEENDGWNARDPGRFGTSSESAAPLGACTSFFTSGSSPTAPSGAETSCADSSAATLKAPFAPSSRELALPLFESPHEEQSILRSRHTYGGDDGRVPSDTLLTFFDKAAHHADTVKRATQACTAYGGCVTPTCMYVRMYLFTEVRGCGVALSRSARVCTLSVSVCPFGVRGRRGHARSAREVSGAAAPPFPERNERALPLAAHVLPTISGVATGSLFRLSAKSQPCGLNDIRGAARPLQSFAVA